jgi:hypothetical protein
MSLQFASKNKNLMVQTGELINNQGRKFVRKSIGATAKKVESSRHTIYSGPPGVGKTFGTIEECIAAGKKYIVIAPGTTDVELAVKLAHGVYTLQDGEELVVILDDADDVVFGNYAALNKWKIAMADAKPELGIMPAFNHAVSMINTINALEKAGKNVVAEALKSYSGADSMGVEIPMDRVRFVILCNLDLEDPKAFSRNPKMKSAVDPVIDRMNYKRVEVDKKEAWGWLAYVLSVSQPFEREGFPLTDDQKVALLDWMWSNWDDLRSTSYRTVEKLAEDMINYPDEYEDYWEEKLKGH